MAKITFNKKIAQITLTCFSVLSGLSQSIITNGSFELYNKCPDKFGIASIRSNLNYCSGWFNPTKASPDYFNKCSTSPEYSVPKNYFGNQNPYHGDAYVGIGLFLDTKNREYIETKLTASIIAKKKYCLKLYINLPDKAILTTNEIDIAFSKKKLKSRDKKILSISNYISIILKTPLKNKSGWTMLSYSFNGEDFPNSKYMTIGWFKEQIEITTLSKKKPSNGLFDVYYLIDNISLEEIKDSTECPCNLKEEARDTLKTIYTTNNDYHKKIYTLKNINFANNKFDLPKNNLGELDTLAAILKSDLNLKIKIEGHTDDRGKEENNQLLSEKRAETIKKYLMQNGITEERIETNGYGSSMPITENDTEAGRSINRRVEIIFE